MATPTQVIINAYTNVLGFASDKANPGAVESAFEDSVLEGRSVVNQVWEQWEFPSVLKFCKWSRSSWDCLHDSALLLGTQNCQHRLIADYLEITQQGLDATANLESWTFADAKERAKAEHYRESISLRARLSKSLSEKDLGSVYKELQKALAGQIEPGQHAELQEFPISPANCQDAKTQAEAGILLEAYRILNHKLLLVNLEFVREQGPYGESLEDHIKALTKTVRHVEALLDASLQLQPRASQLASFRDELNEKLLSPLQEEIVDPLYRLAADRALNAQSLTEDQISEALKAKVERISPLQQQAGKREREISRFVSPTLRSSQSKFGINPRRWPQPAPKRAATPKATDRFRPSDHLVELVLRHSLLPEEPPCLAAGQLADKGADSATSIGNRIEGLLANLATRAAFHKHEDHVIADVTRFLPDFCDELVYRLDLERYAPGPVFDRLHQELTEFAARPRKRSWGRLVANTRGLRLQIDSAGALRVFDPNKSASGAA